MDIQDAWERALKHTEIIRPRVKSLHASKDTLLPYIFLSESTLNLGDTVVRKGEVMVHKPALILPPHNPQFDGFDLDSDGAVGENNLVNFLLVRGVQMPSMQYNNTTHSLDVHEDGLHKAVSHYRNILQKKENVQAGLLTGPEDCWQFSVLIYICTQIVRNSEADIRHLMKKFHDRDK